MSLIGKLVGLRAKLVLAALLMLGAGLGTWKVLDWKADAGKLEATEAALLAEKENAAEMAGLYLKAMELQHELQERHKSASADADRVARKLRDYIAKLPKPAPRSSGAVEAGEKPGSAEGTGEGAGLQGLPAVIDAGQSDAVNLTGWQEWCAAIPEKIRPKGC